VTVTALVELPLAETVVLVFEGKYEELSEALLLTATAVCEGAAAATVDVASAAAVVEVAGALELCAPAESLVP
jgi:hypothetical protein